MKAFQLPPPPPPSKASTNPSSGPIPSPKPDEVLIQIKALSSTRLPPSPSSSPFISSIEAVGLIVVSSPTSQTQTHPHLSPGTKVSTILTLPTSTTKYTKYSPYICIPTKHIQILRSDTLPWEVLGRIPQFYVAWGALIRALDLRRGQRVLIRGVDNPIGMAGIEVGRCHGVDVVGVPSSSSFSITRRSKVEEGKEGEEEEEEEGEEEIDHQFDKILHLTGPDTLADSMSRAKRGGTVCLVSGSPADAGRVGSVDLMDLIPSEVKLTVYKPDMEQFMTTPFEALVREIERGRIKVPAARVLRVEDMSETQMEEVENKEDASGKVVVLF